jgi:hypothetical protein
VHRGCKAPDPPLTLLYSRVNHRFCNYYQLLDVLSVVSCAEILRCEYCECWLERNWVEIKLYKWAKYIFYVQDISAESLTDFDLRGEENVRGKFALDTPCS